MVDRDVRIGLVGYGFGGRYFHAPFIATSPGCALSGVVTGSSTRRSEVEADHPGVPLFNSVDELVAAGVDAVTVCTPAPTHTAVTDDLLRRGVPVVCDKPFAMDAADARRTVELSESLDVLLTVYQNRRWDADLLTVRRVLASGDLGSVRRFESRFENWDPDPDTYPSGGGLLRDIGSHLVDQALTLFGPVERVYAETHEVAAEQEDDALLLLRHVGGVRSLLSAARRQAAPGPRFRVTGTDGSVVVDSPSDAQFHALIEGRRPGTEGEDWGREAEAAWGRLAQSEQVRPVPSERGRWDLFYEELARAVRGDGPVPVDPWDAVSTANVLDAARRSAAEGRTVDVPEVAR